MSDRPCCDAQKRYVAIASIGIIDQSDGTFIKRKLVDTQLRLAQPSARFLRSFIALFTVFLASWLRRRSPALRAMQDFVIRQYQRHHGFHHWSTPNAHTGIVPALGSHFGRLALARHALDGRGAGARPAVSLQASSLLLSWRRRSVHCPAHGDGRAGA